MVAKLSEPLVEVFYFAGRTAAAAVPRAAALGYALSLRGLTVLNASLAAMKSALTAMASGAPMPPLLSFDELYRDVGFDDHYAWEARFEGKLAS